jgi:hypothetical protein
MVSDYGGIISGPINRKSMVWSSMGDFPDFRFNAFSATRYRKKDSAFPARNRLMRKRVDCEERHSSHALRPLPVLRTDMLPGYPQ